MEDFPTLLFVDDPLQHAVGGNVVEGDWLRTSLIDHSGAGTDCESLPDPEEVRREFAVLRCLKFGLRGGGNRLATLASQLRFHFGGERSVLRLLLVGWLGELVLQPA